MFKLAVIGQGYVGLPLALEFSKYFPVIGFDINNNRIEELKVGIDHTCEREKDDILKLASNYDTSNCLFGYLPSSDVSDIRDANVYIITVPTPIDDSKSPNLLPLENASKLVGSLLKVNDIVVYESTVYPGCTEEFCIPILEKNSGLLFNKEFFVGYSPERIVPGDKINTLSKIVKITSGSTPDVANVIDSLYKKIIQAGTYLAPSIKVAEAAKAIENAQRDLNISFVNELALIFDRVGIDTSDVLDAAATKFNFLKYRPGLVGGHCISVDPYYLTHKSMELGYHPNVILSGRSVNDSMPVFIASKVLKLMIKKGIKIENASILILGFTFKEHCPDTRNTKVFQLYKELTDFGCKVSIFDPWANKEKVLSEYGLSLLNEIDYSQKYDGIILSVAHDDFLDIDIKKLRKLSSVVYDIKSFLERGLVDARL